MKFVDNKIVNEDDVNIFDFNITVDGLRELMDTTQCRVSTSSSGTIEVVNCQNTNCVSTNCTVVQCSTIQCKQVNCISTNCTTVNCNEVQCPTYTRNDNHHCPSFQCINCYQCNTVRCYTKQYDDDCSDDGGGE